MEIEETSDRSVGISIIISDHQAQEKISELKLSIGQLIRACRPKWYDVRGWFCPIILNIDFDKTLDFHTNRES